MLTHGCIETGFLCLGQAVPELRDLPDSVLSARTKGVCHHVWRLSNLNCYSFRGGIFVSMQEKEAATHEHGTVLQKKLFA